MTTPNTDSTLPEKLDEIFSHLKACSNVSTITGVNQPSLLGYSVYGMPNAKQQIIALIQEAVDEVIGADEIPEMVNYNEGWREDDTVFAQNLLRAEQRLKLANLKESGK